MVTAKQSQTLTPNPELYLLGHSYDEERRLKQQAEELRQESARMFDRIGIEKGSRAIDLGCGPQGVLDILSERVGPAGQVVGVERDRGSVAEAERFVADRALRNVSVIERDAAATAIPEASIDLVHARLLLVNVPHAESVVQEMIRLARPGGVVASHEADYLPHLCDPPLRAWDRLFEIFKRYSASNGIDLFVGRRVHRLFCQAGLKDIEVHPIIHVYPHGHGRKLIFWQFLQNVRDRILEQGLIAEAEFSECMAGLKEHLGRPDTLVVSHLFFQVWGRKPGLSSGGVRGSESTMDNERIVS